MAKPGKGSDATRLIRSGAGDRRLLKTVGPPIQRGSTVLLPDAASLYDHSNVTYGRAGLGVHEALAEALCELEGARHVRLFPSGLAAVTAAASRAKISNSSASARSAALAIFASSSPSSVVVKRTCPASVWR